MLQQVRETVDRHQMLSRGSRVSVAVSGGADSVCLLHVLLELAPTWELTLSVAHLNHRLRGAESDGDEAFVAALAAHLGLQFHIAAADLSCILDDNLEQAGRRARQRFFGSLDVDCIALGHTLDDQAETVLFRLLRGSGLRGLAGIHPVSHASPHYIRPLINVHRTQVEAFLRDRGIAWREDSSNLDPRFARNRLRHSLLPQLARDWNPHVRESLAQLATLAHDEELWWRYYIDNVAAGVWVERDGALELRASAVAELPLAVARRVIRRAIERLKGDLRGVEYDHIEQILLLARQVRGTGCLPLPGLQVCRSFDWIYLAQRAESPQISKRQLAIPGVYDVANGASLHLEIAASATWPMGSGELSSSSRTNGVTLKAAELSLRRLPGPLELRGWKPGDRYRPEGHTRDLKIKDLFQRERVPVWQRPAWPIVSSGDQILWARTFGAAAEFAAGRESGPVLRVWEMGLPNS